MTLDFPVPLSPTIRKCLFSASRGIRSGSFESSVVRSDAGPCYGFGELFCVYKNGTFEAASIAKSLIRRMSFGIEKGS